MHGTHLRPVEDAVGEPMLQIPKTGSMLEVSKGGVARDTLKLRIVYHQFQARIASGCGKDRACFKQSVGNGVGKIGPFNIPHGGLGGSWVQEVALDHFRPFLTQFIGPRIELMDQGANLNALFQKKSCYQSSG
jgi:hypothetical protein